MKEYLFSVQLLVLVRLVDLRDLCRPYLADTLDLCIEAVELLRIDPNEQLYLPVSLFPRILFVLNNAFKKLREIFNAVDILFKPGRF